ncbi:autotransporter-associated beta strand repeat-containing protein [Luteolibacter arcticus]|uniref:Autotransporter-associated beta strand repeat-containing protein n=1 Tax=Luteolibacter arcticus TaxID=1581411 RepID=A0ABT3GQG1_9BACT|nr:autotransporter-associated beta strand repeat-containing protein [Luteolibacter arcticus]MCW1925719.1 autotransporter-associated beta strand repeat-containing protein [Luteolibacter arcticus]
MKPRKNSSRPSGHFFTASLATFVATASLHADTLTWDADGLFNNGTLGSTGTWDTTSTVWDDGVADVAWINNATTPNSALFSGTAGTVTIGAAINVDALIFSTSGYTIERGGGQVVTIGGNKLIETGDTGTSTTINAKLTGASVPITGSGTVTFGGTDDNSAFSMVVEPGATAILAKDSTASVHVVGTTGVTISDGAVAKLAGTGGDQIFNNGTVTINGGIFDLNGTSETINNLTGATGTVDNTAAGAAVLTLGSNNGSATYSGTIQNSVGSLGITKIGSGTATLSGTNTYTGATTLSAGSLVLSGAGNNLSGSSATPITLNAGEFRLDNSIDINTDRIPNTQAIALNGGAFLNFIGNEFGATMETVGALTLGTAASSGQARIGMTGTVTNSSTLTMASLTRSAGGVVPLVNGTELGTDSTSDIPRIIVTSPPTLVGTTAAFSTGINGAAKDTAIVPFLVGDVTAATGGAGVITGVVNTFLTHNSTTGLRPLNLEDEFTLNATIAGNNTYITANTAATNDSVNSLVLSGTPTLSITDVTLTNASGSVLFGGTTGTTNITGAGTGALAFGSNEAIVTVNSGVTGVVSAILTGSAGLTKSGTGTLTLSGTNTLSGAFNVNSGTLRLQTSVVASGTGTNNAIPTGATVNVANGSVLNLTNTASGSTPATQLTVNLNNFALNLNGGTSLTVTSSNYGKYNLPGDIKLTGSNTISVTPIRATLALSGVISGTGNLTFSASGAQNSHFLTLSNANTYAGSTGITATNSGATILLSGGADRLPTTTTVTISGSGTNLAQLNLGGQNQTLAGLISAGTAGNAAVVNTGGGTPVLTVNQASGVSTTFSGILGGATALSGTFASVSGNSFGLTKSGLGTQVLGGTNLYTGATLVNAGTLSLTNIAALGASSGVTVANGATLLVDNGASSYTGNLTISGAGVGGVGALNLGSTGANSRFTAGSVTIANGDSAAFGSTRTSAGNIVNNITGGTVGSPVSLSKVGPGILSWESANGYVGTVTVAEGILNLASTSATPITGAVTVNPGATLSLGRTNNQINDSADVSVNGTFDLNNDTNAGAARPRNETIRTLSGASTGIITTTSTVLSTSGINSGRIVTSGTSGMTTFAGVMQDGTRQVLFTKGGAYTQVLTGTNTYTGATTITGGTLSLGATGSVAESASITIGAGAVLNTSDQSFVMAGDQPVTFNVDPSASGSSGRIQAAALDIDGAVVVISPTATLDDGAYVLADYTSLEGAEFASESGVPVGYDIDYGYNGGTQIALVQTSASGYDSWALDKGLDGTNSDELDDPNHNGIANLLEYVLNGDPLNAQSPAEILPTLNASGMNFVFTFTRLVDSAPDTTQTFQYGTNLDVWTSLNISPGTPAAGVVIGTPTGGSPNTQTVTVTVAKGANTKLFGRLQAEK